MSRLLLRLPNWLGDMIMALPALQAVRTRWPEAHLTVALPRAFADLTAMVPGIDATLPLTGRGWRHEAALGEDSGALRAGAFDAIVLFTNSFSSARMAHRAAIPERWGYRTDFRGPLLTRAVARPRGSARGSRHHSRYYGYLVEQLGCPVGEYEVRVEVPAAWKTTAAGLLAEGGIDGSVPLLGIAPGAAYGTAKRWPPDRVAGVVAGIQAAGPVACVLVGSAGDAGAGRLVEAALHTNGAPLLNLIGRTDLPALAGVMALSTAFLSNDSGAMHLASAVATRTVAVFGPTDEHATAPLGPHALVTGRAWCRPCLRRTCPLDHRCMTSISTASVLDALGEGFRQTSVNRGGSGFRVQRVRDSGPVRSNLEP